MQKSEGAYVLVPAFPELLFNHDLKERALTQ